jgi:hypothetical protein
VRRRGRVKLNLSKENNFFLATQPLEKGLSEAKSKPDVEQKRINKEVLEEPGFLESDIYIFFNSLKRNYGTIL